MNILMIWEAHSNGKARKKGHRLLTIGSRFEVCWSSIGFEDKQKMVIALLAGNN